MMRSAYEVLGISPDANDDQIKDAYLRHAKALHPDHNKRPTAEKEFKEVGSAYNTLKDALARREHDYALAKVSADSVADDETDDVLKAFSIDKPKKKKKKKKKKMQAVEPQHQNQFVTPHYAPPPRHDTRFEGGQSDYERIPDGYDRDDSLGGIF